MPHVYNRTFRFTILFPADLYIYKMQYFSIFNGKLHSFWCFYIVGDNLQLIGGIAILQSILKATTWCRAERKFTVVLLFISPVHIGSRFLTMIVAEFTSMPCEITVVLICQHPVVIWWAMRVRSSFQLPRTFCFISWTLVSLSSTKRESCASWLWRCHCPMQESIVVGHARLSRGTGNLPGLSI